MSTKGVNEHSMFPRVEQLFRDSLSALEAEKARRRHEELLERQLVHRTRVAAIAMACIAVVAIAAGAIGWNEQIKAVGAEIRAQREAEAVLTAQSRHHRDEVQLRREFDRSVILAGKAKIAAGLAEQQKRAAEQQAQVARQQTQIADFEKARIEAAAEVQRRQLESSQLAEMDRVMITTTGFDPRLARLIGATAYSAFPETFAGRDALLEAAESPEALARVALPPWSLGAVAGNGQFVAVLAGERQRRYAQTVTGSLVALRAFPSAILSRAANVHANFMCGFESSPSVAVAAFNRVDRYDLRGRLGPELTASRIVAPLRAMACAPRPETVVYVDSQNRLGTLSFARPAPDLIAQLSGPRAVGIRLSQSGSLAAVTLADGKVSIYDLHRRKPLLASTDTLLKDLTNDCSPVAGCAGAVAFTPDDRHLTWYDRGNIYVEPIAASATARTIYPCPSEYCAQPLLVFPSTAILPSVVGRGRYANAPPATPAPGETPASYTETYDNQSGTLQPHPLWDRQLAMYIIEYDPWAESAPNAFGSGIAMESLVEIGAPMIGTVPAAQWTESYILRGHFLLIPASSEGRFISYDLPHLRDNFDKEFSVSYRVRVRDSGDGVHAVTYNYTTGETKVLDMRSAPRRNPIVIARFLRERVNDVGGKYVRSVQIAYDPRAKIVTLLSNTIARSHDSMVGGELHRFDLSGRLVESLSEKQLANSAGVDVSSIGAWYLSQRGNYITLNLNPPKADVMLKVDGTRIGSAYAIGAVSPDETFALGLRKGDLARKYLLPSWHSSGIMGVPWSNQAAQFMAIAPDGRTAAYASGSKIQLLDLSAKANYKYLLPGPPDIYDFVGLTFSADSRYLIVKYYDASRESYAAVYALDPNQWALSACMTSGRSLSARQFHAMFPGITYRDPCAQYATEMYRW